MANTVDGEPSKLAFHKAQCYPTTSHSHLPPTVSSMPTTCALPPNRRRSNRWGLPFARGQNELGVYYKENHLRPNPAKTQLTAFHLNNRQAGRKLDITWNCMKFEHTHSPVNLGITLDCSLTHIPTETIV